MPKAQKPTVKAKAATPVKKTGTQTRATTAKSTTKTAAPVKRAPAPAKAAPPAKSAAKTTKAAAPAKTATKTTKVAPAKVAPAKVAPKTAAPAPAKAAATPRKSPQLDKFLLEQREMLEAERADYLEKAAELKAEADSLALEHEPGDIQFDEEGGEGGTTNVDRELDLVLSAQARAAVDEIDRALTKIAAGTYGLCERCGKEIPKPRLKALPYAALCVQCKSGGLSHR